MKDSLIITLILVSTFLVAFIGTTIGLKAGQ